MKDLLVRKNLNRPLIHIFTHREIGVFVPIQCEIQSLNGSFWNALKNIQTLVLRYFAYVCIFLYIFIFHFIPSPLHFSFSKVTLPPVQTFGICVGYTDRVQCCCKSAIHTKQLPPKWGCRVTHVPWQRVPQGDNTCLHRAKQSTLLPNWLLLGLVKLSQDSTSKDAKDPCTLQNISTQTAAES